MTTRLPVLWTLAGIAVIAGVFFLLHRLRVQQRSLVVETTLFWRQAIEETRARVFVQRFRHPWTYLFLVLISTLLWLGFAGLERTPSAARESLVLIDASATMARGDRFAATLALTEDLVEALPRASRTVMLCGGRVRTVLRPHEHARLLRERLAGALPEASPSSVEVALRGQLARKRRGKLRVFVAGDATLDTQWVSSLPDDVEVVRLTPPAEASTANRGITSLGVAPAQSGAWDKIDLLVEVSATGASSLTTPAVAIDSDALAITPERQGSGNAIRFVYRDVATKGQQLDVSLPSGDALGIDDTARFLLPEHRQLRIAIENGVPDLLTDVVRADPALSLVTTSPDVVIRRFGSAFGASAPALELVAEESQANAFLIQHEADQDPYAVLTRLHDRLGLAEIDATEVARRSGRVISMGASPGPVRGLRVWQSLFSNEWNFVASRSFPLFVAASLRWISGAWTAPATLPVGRHTDLSGARLTSPDGHALTSLGDAFTPTMAGIYQVGNGRRIAAALLDPASTAPPQGAAALPNADAPGSAFDLTTALLLSALVLLLVEWALYQRGRLP